MESSDNYSSAYESSHSYHSDTAAPLPRENRGKKGLTHAEMARFRVDQTSATESEDDQQHPSDPYDDDSRDQHSQPSRNREEIKVEPVVKEASELLEKNGLETNAIGYAKLTGSGRSPMDYIVKMQAISIGRLGFGCDCEVRSDSKHVSRRHALLFWRSQFDRWFIQCVSRKGLVVDGTPLSLNSAPISLSSRSLIEIGDVSFYFLLPNASTFRVNNIELLQKKIMASRAMRDAYSDNPDSDFHQPRFKSARKGRWSTGRADSSTGKKARAKYGSKKSMKKTVRAPSVQYSSSDSDSEKEEEFTHDILDDPKYKPHLLALPSKPGKRKASRERSHGKRKRRKVRNSEDMSDDEYDTVNEDEDEWSKKERADFARALFIAGVDPIYDDDNNVTGYDWERFREIAFLPGRNDSELFMYYRRFMADVHTLLEEEEREKRTKGPRTKHKKGCDCIVCVNTAKSRERKRASQNLEDRIPSDDDDPKATGKPSDKLVGLVTAQKLRVRVGIHEASRHFREYTPTAQAVIQKLEAQSSRPKDLPSWWKIPYHDKSLMKGMARHGVGMWEAIWSDEYCRAFSKVFVKGPEAAFPTPQAAMKRVRDISSMVTSELKKVAKKQRDMQRYKRRKARREARKNRKEKGYGKDERETPPPPRAEADISTAEESASEDDAMSAPKVAVDVETEDDSGEEADNSKGESDADGIEDYGTDDEAEEPNAETPRVGEAYVSTEEEVEEVEEEVEVEDAGQYETVSETASD